jgi:hypothetical protein
MHPVRCVFDCGMSPSLRPAVSPQEQSTPRNRVIINDAVPVSREGIHQSHKLKGPRMASAINEIRSFPCEDAYPLVTPINFYQRGYEMISEQCQRTDTLKDSESGSRDFETYVVVRMNLVIWVCCTIESCVNLEGVSWTGEEFYKDAVERQKITAKIRLLYALKHGKRLPKDEPILKELKSLFDVRNHYVHPKTCAMKENQNNINPNFEKLLAYKAEELWDLVQRLNGLLRDPESEEKAG